MEHFNIRKISTTLAILLVTVLMAIGQVTRPVQGVVFFAEDNTPAPGANVILKGTTTGTISDLDGKFTLNAASTDVLVVSFTGFTTQEILVGDQTRIEVFLQEELVTLSEIVVVGYGQMKRSDLSSAQVSIGSKEIEATRAISLDQALQGKAANVYVTRNSGQPGGAISVNVRGINSIAASTEPLYVIDGVQILGSTGNTTNALAGINPNDIESMTILQGPSATSVYGSRAANGVIVITTKRGKAGMTKINYRGGYSLQDEPDLVPTMNLREYAGYQNELARVNGWAYNPAYADPSVLGEGTNWQDELFKRTGMHQHQLSLSGGNDKTRFYFSGEYLNQEGVAIGSGFNRGSVRLNLDNEVRDWLSIGSNIMASQTNEDIGVTSEQDLINQAIQQGPNIAVKNPDGTWGGPDETQFHLSNPVALAEIVKNHLRRWNMFGGMFAEVKFFRGMSFRTEFNGNVQTRRREFYNPSYKFDGFVKDINQSKREAGNNYGWNFLTLLKYERNIGRRHFISLMASHEAQEANWDEITATRQGFIINTIQELNAGDPTTAENTSTKGSWALESYFGRLNYVFNDRYIIQATLRADGSPIFGENNRWGYFPSVSAAWKLSEEPFLRDVEAIENIKLRFEYGITGNQNSGGNTIYGVLNSYATPWGTGFLQGNYPNPDFKWEETETYNAGLDVNLFHNRVELIVDAYLKKTDNLMLQIPLPAYLGSEGTGAIKAPWVNIGAMENRGFGLTLNTVNIASPLLWRTGLIFSLDRNKLTALYNESSLLDRAPWFMSGFLERSVIGEPVWQFYIYETDGLFQNVKEIEDHAVQNGTGIIDPVIGTWVGDIKFVDQNGDDVIDEQDRKFLGNPWPKFTYGLTNTFAFKNFELNIFLQGVYGNDIFNYQRFVNANPNGSGPGRNYLVDVLDAAKVVYDDLGNPYLANPDTDIPRINSGDPNLNNRPNDSFVEDGSYLRIQNVQLSYNFPQTWFKRMPVKGLMLSVGVQNLYTFTKYKGYDPEIGQYRLSEFESVVGIDYNRYPTVRVYNMNLSVDF